MSATVIEQILAAAAAALAGKATTVARGREAAFSEEELPAINVMRASHTTDVASDRLHKLTVDFDLECQVAVVSGWDTAVDALHASADSALLADTSLAALCRSLRCTGTDIAGDSAARELGKLTAHYQAQVFVRPGDLTRAIK